MQGRGAVLQQRDDHKPEVPICFASRVLRVNEVKRPSTELEAFAVVWALETFRVCIEGSPTLVRTDHSPLLWVRNNVGKSSRLARWVLRLQEFAFDLQHRAADATLWLMRSHATPLVNLSLNSMTSCLAPPCVLLSARWIAFRRSRDRRVHC